MSQDAHSFSDRDNFHTPEVETPVDTSFSEEWQAFQRSQRDAEDVVHHSLLDLAPIDSNNPIPHFRYATQALTSTAGPTLSDSCLIDFPVDHNSLPGSHFSGHFEIDQHGQAWFCAYNQRQTQGIASITSSTSPYSVSESYYPDLPEDSVGETRLPYPPLPASHWKDDEDDSPKSHHIRSYPDAQEYHPAIIHGSGHGLDTLMPGPTSIPPNSSFASTFQNEPTFPDDLSMSQTPPATEERHFLLSHADSPFSDDSDFHHARTKPKSAAEQLFNGRAEEDKFLLDMRVAGKTYREIRRLGGFKISDSTLRGRFRDATKPKEERVRKPEWKAFDVGDLSLRSLYEN